MINSGHKQCFVLLNLNYELYQSLCIFYYQNLFLPEKKVKFLTECFFPLALDSVVDANKLKRVSDIKGNFFLNAEFTSKNIFLSILKPVSM